MLNIRKKDRIKISMIKQKLKGNIEAHQKEEVRMGGSCREAKGRKVDLQGNILVLREPSKEKRASAIEAVR